ncbi:kelch-like protein 18 [Uloborus diversus]|uniref:kelch-like protein 18 n=1 Tax=Uloborus diversus TaxID=327109 RepID=UPI002409D6C9|nr:kelch-like protein 18 [Uloborus diversus]
MSAEDSITFVQTDLADSSFPVFEDIKRDGKLCDVTLKVENRLFYAHRIILAGTIPYFRAMFTNDMIESKQTEINIKDIDPDAVELLINFAYSGKVQISTSNVQSLLVGASFFQLSKVREACCEFLKRRLHPNNALGIRTFADALGCSTLVDATNRYLQKHFLEVCRSEEFINLQLADVREIVSRDELHITSEEQVFEAVLSWVKHESSRKDYLPELLTQVRMPLLTPQYLTDYVATEELIRTSHQCRDLLDEAKDYHLMPERRPLLQSFRTRVRCCPDIVGCIYAVGGLTKSGDSLSTVEVYDPKVGRWQLAEAMTMLRSRVGVAVMHNKLYAIGGYNGTERLSTVEVYDPEARTWTTASCMNCKRSAVGAATLFNKLYVCGGYDGISSLNTVECYDPEKNEWKMVTSMSKHRSAAGVVSFEDHIYALGGHDGLSIFDSVERYDPHSDHWTPMPSMLSKRCRLGVATLNGKIYVCGGYDGSTFLMTAEVYNPSTRQWSYIASMNTMRSRVALVANCGKLYAIGGYDGIANLSSVEIYNPEINRWDFVSPMCAHEGGVGVGVIPS